MTKVMFNTRLGTLIAPEATRFEDECVEAGDTGILAEPHPMLDGWHMAKTEIDGKELWVPCHPSHFEIIEA